MTFTFNCFRQAEVEKHKLVVEYFRRAGVDSNIQDLKHRRIVDIGHVITESRKLEGHECKDGKKGHFSFDREVQKGLDSVLHFSCQKCGEKTNFHTHVGGSAEINAGMAMSMLATGKGHDHFEEIMTCLDVPCPSRDTYKVWEKKAGQVSETLHFITSAECLGATTYVYVYDMCLHVRKFLKYGIKLISETLLSC